MTTTAPTGELAAVLAEASLVVTCGPGGVGKTTSAAALALAAARSGRNTVVVTVDPARRLADALGVDLSGEHHDPHLVAGAVDPTTDHPDGALWVLMLDAETTFDRLVTERAGDPARAQAILANPVYRSIAGSLSGAQEYMAIERLHQLVTGGEYDLVVIDTPPSRHAIDLLQAPDRLVSFFGHPVYRTLTLPTRGFARVTNAASSAFLWAVRRLAGPRIVEDTIEFFRSLSGLESGLRQRAAEAAAILRRESTAFVLVSSPRAEAIDEATHLAGALRDGRFPLRGIVVNLVHPAPAPLTTTDVGAGGVAGGVADGPLADLLAAHHDLGVLAAAERTELDALRALAGDVPLAEVPVLDEDVHDLDGLARVAALVLDR